MQRNSIIKQYLMAASGSCLSKGETLNKASTDGRGSRLGQMKQGLSSLALPTLHMTIWGIFYPAPVSFGDAQLRCCYCCHLPNPEGRGTYCIQKDQDKIIFDYSYKRERMPHVPVFVFFLLPQLFCFYLPLQLCFSFLTFMLIIYSLQIMV